MSCHHVFVNYPNNDVVCIVSITVAIKITIVTSAFVLIIPSAAPW